MPIVEAHILEGYSATEKSRLTSALTNAIRFVVPAPDVAITVMLHEYPSEAYARGGQHRQPAPALPDPSTIVRDYLTSMEARDLEAAQSMLREDFQMVFPATDPMTRLSELIEWSKARYRSVKKTYDGFDALHGNGVAVVYARGTLHGEWLDGTPFDGIRFIDRFEISEGKIVRQDVWNDMGEVRAQ
ncbi:nuclear transport factor 2 family protein [Marivita hallyeonensis]|uniref:Phenylpyruvate tautomerase PptA, 4-oxalocrotonate tautomerase family n=1 Tax=Marivita hallyeonensis TaxID=996342 RepID=A0A1M5X309_9RHOB|nr:nuclear transport factor 2 family protein [Marivita hallyeonensis]SHH94171.1 Phenylpyruvate tautomerase PptA, 4-oxalocrotonate tautomerase family [Marivita hallyeonensis]